MAIDGPIVIGGNGHSGTRVFTEIVTMAGVFTGVKRLTKRSNSDDLRVFDLMNKWASPFVYGELDSAGLESMKRAFARRLRLCFPFRKRPWGFKEPRTMLILPVLNELFPNMRFVHVIRDGRDISLGNKFVFGNRYVDAFLTGQEKSLPPEEKMILFWGRSNQAAREYGNSKMSGRYLLMRWEDLCHNAAAKSAELLLYASCAAQDAAEISRIISRPKSMGRWKLYPDEVRNRVAARGKPWLELFGYA